MTLDNEQQRAFLLEMFKQVNFPGNVLEVAYSVQQAIKRAEVTPVPPLPQVGLPTLGAQELARASDNY